MLEPSNPLQPSDDTFDIAGAIASAQAALVANRLDEAEGLCSMILRTQPLCLPAMTILAIIASKRGQIGLAIDRMREVMKFEADPYEATVWVANLLREQKSFKEAIDLCGQLIWLKPKNSSGPLTMGLCFLDQKQPLKALEYIQQAISLDPSAANLHYYLGVAQQMLMRIDDAAAAYRRAIELAPDVAMYHDALARMLFSHGRQAESLEYQRRAVEGRVPPPDRVPRPHGASLSGEAGHSPGCVQRGGQPAPGRRRPMDRLAQPPTRPARHPPRHRASARLY